MFSASAEEDLDCCSIMSVLTVSQGHDWVELKHLQTLKYQLLDGVLLFQITHSGFFAVYDYEYDVVPNSAKSLLQHSIASGHQSVSAATSNTLSLCYFWSQHPTHCIRPRRETKLSFVCSRSVQLFTMLCLKLCSLSLRHSQCLSTCSWPVAWFSWWEGVMAGVVNSSSADNKTQMWD